MRRHGRPFEGRQREEKRRARRALRAKERLRVWKTYTIRVNVASRVGSLLSNQSNVTEFVRTTLDESISMNIKLQDQRKQIREQKDIIKNLEQTLKNWEIAWLEDKHALGEHLDQPSRRCPACQDS